MDQHYSDRMMSAYEMMPNNRNLCYAGCSDCCHGIKLTQAEFLYIIDGLEAKGSGVPKSGDNGSCEFLQDGLCAVYERRPWICRIYAPKKDKCGFCPTEDPGRGAIREIWSINKSMGFVPEFMPLRELIGAIGAKKN